MVIVRNALASDAEAILHFASRLVQKQITCLMEKKGCLFLLRMRETY